MIEVRSLSKQYGSTLAVDDVSFTAGAGRVTGFLGPNGAGKSTTMRMIVGLDRPTHGIATVNGRPYADHANPMQQVGALLEARAIHPGVSARNHLRALAATHRIPNRRVDEVIELTGLETVAKKRAGEFSLGMGQRLGIAAALLGDPQSLILDEPVNGLDPEGVRWVRNLLRYLASQGRTVFISSHLMSEMAQTADDLVVIGRGKIVATGTVDEVITRVTNEQVRVRTPHVTDLTQLLRAGGIQLTSPEPQVLLIEGANAAQIGELAAAHHIVLHELTPTHASLEDAYMTLTADAVEFAAGGKDHS